MELDAASIDAYQRCRRRHVLAADWRYARWRPRSLFASCLRHAAAALAAGTPSDAVATDAVTEFMTAAADPGLDVLGVDPYRVARDWTAMLETVVLTLGMVGVGRCENVPTASLMPNLTWRFGSQRAADGTLARWVVTDRWDEAALTRELHSWWTMGDVAVARRPMRLRVVELGQSRQGRHTGAWSRAWRHPGLRHLPLRFRLATGKPPKDWKPVWLADLSDVDAADWAEQAWREGATRDLLHEVEVRVPSDATCEDTVRQMVAVAGEMVALAGADWREQPMSRGACDGPFVPCPFAAACYTENLVSVDSLGLYNRRVHDGNGDRLAVGNGILPAVPEHREGGPRLLDNVRGGMRVAD